MSALLDVDRLSVQLPTASGPITIVDDVSYQVEEGQVFGVAGESGSGKTISVLALMRLLPDGASIAGSATFGGRNLLTLRRRALQGVRGREIAMVFQDPLTSLHPMLSIGRQLTEHVRFHEGLGRKAADARARELLEQVRIPDPEGTLHAFPHQFSGGMRQRIAIAVALACRPKLLIADEPTTALDVTVQAGILRLLDSLRKETGLSVILITHDLGVLSAIADSVSVFYAGRIVESGATREVLGQPRHPYTRALLDALPHPEVLGQPRHPYTRALLDALPHPEASADRELIAIAGTPPTPAGRPGGCAFHPRCAYAKPSCAEHVPPLAPIGDGRLLACPIDPFAAQ